MKFGAVPLEEAEGAIAAHSIRHASGVIKKGTRLTAEHIEIVRRAGIGEVVAARLELGDVHEDQAARRVAELLAGEGVRLDGAFTGRCNLYAEAAGLFVVDRAAIDRLNRLDPGLTVATLAEFQPVEAGRMVATVKIIPFAVPGSVLEAAISHAGRPILSVAPWRAPRVGLAATVLPGLKASVMDKTRRVLEERLKRAGARVIDEVRVAHDTAELAGALARLKRQGAELLIAFGASAITDENDVIPAALRGAGGRVLHLGMPVDPGNLLMVGELDGATVLGAPGCARSPAENGFDWVLNRILAGIDVTPEHITGMGVGGLLMEIVSRPQPREPAEAAGDQVAAVILAAGQSRRMGGPNKLTARFDGEPLIRKVAERALRSAASSVIVVTGHRPDEIAAALAGLDVAMVHNPDFADGLATSLKSGLAAVPDSASGALVVLADMPGVSNSVMDRLIVAFRARKGPAIILPTVDGKRGNPVLWSREFFPELLTVAGDTGARHLLAAHEEAVERVEIGAAAGLDVDTPEALRLAGGVLAGAD
ncbi:MAG: molybdopterin-binding/glycosyltransferase family 2 protein [Pseudomonadota bacterium]|nr:molybdopterin-binding/glycosyltransferase family 2 protein [Pseudomonadota bacterium]